MPLAMMIRINSSDRMIFVSNCLPSTCFLAPADEPQMNRP
jgi:hypothetical protein